MIAATLALLLSPPPTLWAGYQEVAGERDVPVLGTVTTRNRTWFLARWEPEGDGYVLRQRTCGVDFDRVMGVAVKMPDRLLARLPVTTARFAPRADGSWFGQWESGWGAEDLDADGRPGVTIVVDAPMCGGRVQVTSSTVSRATLKPDGEALAGGVVVDVTQSVLDASNACLRSASEDTREQHRGWMRLVPVPPDSTCGRWRTDEWPARAAHD
jgi:hypothetical protein